MDKEMMEQIMEETRKLFIAESQIKAQKAYHALVNYCIVQNEADRYFLENFFHSTKGSAGICGFMDLSLYSKDFEAFMKGQKDKNQLTDDNRVYIFTGICKILSDINTLFEKHFDEQSKELLKNSQDVKEDVAQKTHSTELNTLNPSIVPKQNTSINLAHEHLSGNILIIDDDITLLDHLERSLSLAGYKTYITTSPDDVQLIILSKEIDIIIIDILLPEKNGFEIFESIKKCNYEGGVVFLTGNSEMNDKLSGFKMGADDYITKPFSTDELIARLERIIKTKLITNSKINKDDMTKAYSRGFFYEKFKNAISNLETVNKSFALALVDIDNFRDINRNNGFFVGDMILRKFVDELKNNFSEEMIFRLEGDKFIILLEHYDSIRAYNILDKILSSLRTKYFAPLKNPISFSSIIYNVENVHDNLETVINSLIETLDNSKIFGNKKIEMIEKELEVFRKPRILIVDDESVTVYLIKKRLESFGYDIFYANDGLDAITKIRQLKPDVVLLDLMLPKLNGFDVAKLIREDEGLKFTKIMVISAKNDEQDVLKCYDLGVDDYIHKPFAFKDLEKRLLRLLKNKTSSIRLESL